MLPVIVLAHSCSNMYVIPADNKFKVKKMTLSGRVVSKEVPFYTPGEINCFTNETDGKIVTVLLENAPYVIPHFYGETIKVNIDVDRWPIAGRYSIKNGFIIHGLHESVNATYRINEEFQVETASCSYGLNGFVRGEKTYYRSFRKVDN